jgi:hypothetical protein
MHCRLSRLHQSGVAVLVVAGLFLSTSAALAQNVGSFDPADNSGAAPTGGPLPDPAGAGQDQAPPDSDAGKAEKQEPPPSLPGSHATPTEVAPLDKATTDMNPNAALFDAINRGDTVAARDALSRGADPNARNVLGLTPIDESVDLGRNDISFLLLSVRTSTAAATPASAASAASPERPANAGRAPARGGFRGGAKPAIVTAGTAVPSAGFLGFSGGS